MTQALLKNELPRRRFMGRLVLGFAGLSLPFGLGRARAESQGEETPYIGEIRLISFGFAPRSWALCNGQLLPINQNQALFSLLGTSYGGNGQTNFALPDLRGRVAIHQGQGPGLTARTVGERAGAELHTLTLAEMPGHTHVARCASQNGTTADASPSVVPARNPAGIPQWGTNTPNAMSAMAIANAGGSQPHNNLQPYTTLHFVIALQGIFPLPEASKDVR